MYRLTAFVFLLLAMAMPAAAQTRVDAPPPVPDAKPPALEVIDDAVEPQVTIKKRGTDTVEEHRINGKLYKITVRPENAPPYTLIDHKGDGSFVPMEGPGTPQLSIPMWVIGTF